MTNSGKVRVAIIGCGLIGAMWDDPQQAQAHGYALTHAAGFSRHPGCELVAMVDVDLARAQLAAARWGVAAAFDDVATMLQAVAPQIVVLAAASHARWSLLEPILAAKTPLCVIEKPLASSLQESQAIVTAFQASHSKSLVNYSRNWDRALRHIGQRLRAGEWGRVQRLQAWYGKGISNNGSHMIDLVSALLQAQVVTVVGSRAPLPASEADWSQQQDLALDAQLNYKNAAGEQIRLDMLATNQADFTCFELRIMLQHAIIDIRQGARSIEIRHIEADPNFANYRIPGAAQALDTGYLQAMDNMVQQAWAIVTGEVAQAHCDAAQALRTALVVQAIKDSAYAGASLQAVG